jgi:hypothetical protein
MSIVQKPNSAFRHKGEKSCQFYKKCKIKTNAKCNRSCTHYKPKQSKDPVIMKINRGLRGKFL